MGNTKKEIRELIRNDELKKALDKISKNQHLFPLVKDSNNIDGLYAQLKRFESQNVRGVLEFEKSEIRRNQILHQILSLTNEIEEEEWGFKNNVSNKNEFPKEHYPFLLKGNEPGWTIKINSQNITFITDYGTKMTIYPLCEMFFGNRIWVYKSKTILNSKIQRIQIMIIEEEAFDNMSGEKFEYSTTVIENLSKVYLGIGILD